MCNNCNCCGQDHTEELSDSFESSWLKHAGVDKEMFVKCAIHCMNLGQVHTKFADEAIAKDTDPNTDASTIYFDILAFVETNYPDTAGLMKGLLVASFTSIATHALKQHIEDVMRKKVLKRILGDLI